MHNILFKELYKCFQNSLKLRYNFTVLSKDSVLVFLNIYLQELEEKTLEVLRIYEEFYFTELYFLRLNHKFLAKLTHFRLSP